MPSLRVQHQAAAAAREAALLRVSKATKKTLDLYAEAVHITTTTSLTFAVLTEQACIDRVELAKGFLGDGQRAMRMRPPQYRSATSRFYYSMYHVARAVVFFVHGGDDFQEHQQLPQKLPADFPDSAIWQNTLKDARAQRNAADYDPYPAASQQWRTSARDLSIEAPNLLAVAQQYLTSKGCRLT